jgi:hypothetical protein
MSREILTTDGDRGADLPVDLAREIPASPEEDVEVHGAIELGPVVFVNIGSFLDLSGERKLLETGQVVGAGGYVYEPRGNVDSWMAVGGEPVIVHITSYGAMEYLGENGRVLRRDTASSLREAYLRYCADNALAPLDLGGEG